MIAGGCRIRRLTVQCRLTTQHGDADDDRDYRGDRGIISTVRLAAARGAWVAKPQTNVPRFPVPTTPINFATSGDYQITTPPDPNAGILVFGLFLMSATPTTVSLYSGMATPARKLLCIGQPGTNGGWVLPLGAIQPWFVCDPGEPLVLNLGGSVLVTGCIVWESRPQTY